MRRRVNRYMVPTLLRVNPRSSIVRCAVLLILTFVQLLPTSYAAASSGGVGIQFVRFSRSNKAAIFRLTNQGTRPLWYWGYSPEEPLHTAMIKQARRWKDVGLGWCGTGRMRNRLESGKSIEVEVDLDFVEKSAWVRVGIAIEQSDAGDRQKTYWSTRFKVQRS